MWSEDLEKSLNKALADAQRMRHEYATVEHMLRALLDNKVAQDVLLAVHADLDLLRGQLTDYIDGNNPRLPMEVDLSSVRTTLAFRRILQRAYVSVQNSGHPEVTAANVLVAIYSEPDSQAVYLLCQQQITRLMLVRYISHGMAPGEDDEGGFMDKAPREEHDGNIEDGIEEEGHSKERALDEFTVNLNDLARNGRIDPLIGRERELKRVMQVLARRKKNNPLLVGEAGVGKTAIAEGLARRIVDQEVPDIIADYTVYSLDLGALLAGTRYRGDFEKRLKQVLKELQNEENAVLFIDEVHTVIGAGAASGGVMDASNLLKPLLASGELRCMGSTTYQEYRGIFDKDRALSRRFQKIDVEEPNTEEAYKILRGLRTYYEEHYDVRYTNKALKQAVDLSKRYISDRFLPDKAIDVIDEAGAMNKLQVKSKQRKQITASDVEKVIASIARIPSRRVNASDKQSLERLGEQIKLVVFGQDKAIDLLSSAIKLSRAGLKDPEKPIGSFLFAGPTGVGKTEVCRQLAYVMGVELLRYDMSEYMERHTVARLIGAPPGYVGYDQGGLLTESVNKHPHSVVLLDEIEKAHPDVFNLLLQVMDYGKLTDNNGRAVDFAHVVLVMTTNSGAQDMSRRSLGFVEQDHSTEGMEAIKKLFTPEFRNRLDAMIQFSVLSPEVIVGVVDKFLNQLQVQLDEKRVMLHVDKKARQWLAEKGYDAQMGARPMDRLIQDKIKRPLADDILFGDLSARGGDVYVSVKKGDLSLDVQSAKKPNIAKVNG